MINIVRLSIYNEYLDDGCTDNPKYVNFFKKYFVKYIAPDDLNHYLYTYVDDLNSFGVFDHLNIEDNDWSEILSTFTNTIDIYFKDIRDFSNKPDYNSIAIARAMNDNCKLDIQVDYSNWNEATNVKRLWIMYHELTHDLFNVEHGHGGPMMNPKLPINMTEQNFLEARETLISYLKLIKFNKTCNQKGKEKLKELLKNNN